MGDNIPSILKNLNIWLCYDDRDKKDYDLLSIDLVNQEKKRPRDITGKPHSINGRLFTYNECIDSVKKGINSGVGIVLKNNGIVCIDYDKVIDHYKSDDKLGIEIPILKKDKEKQILRDIELLNSYTEISPSGKGLHIYLMANSSIKVNVNQNDIEIYTNKFIRVSGKPFNPFLYNEIQERTQELENLLNMYGIELNDDVISKTSVFSKKYNVYKDIIEKKFKLSNGFSSKEIKETMFNSKKGDLLRKLYYNTITDNEYYDLKKDSKTPKNQIDITDSGKSITLIMYLLHFSYGDLKEVYKLFLGSGLCKDKYTEKRYQNKTENIIQHCFIPYAVINYYNFSEW